MTKRVLLFALACIALLACSDLGQGTPPPTEEQNPNVPWDSAGVNILTSPFPSPKEQNPYAMDNMNKTFEDFILANNPNATDIPQLEPNFLYVRFLPYGKQGEYELKTYDDALVLFKHPMDYNEIRKPAVYVDKTLPDSVTAYFATVPVGYEFGSTPYEVLQELFLTQPLEEDDGDDQANSRFIRAKNSNNKNKEIANYLKNQGLSPSQLEMAAFPNSERFNLETEAESDSNNVSTFGFLGIFPDRWRPDGTLKYYDEQKKAEQPLVGVRVTAGYALYWRSSRTNGDGYFKSPERWTWSVNYEANFDADQFLLEDGHSVYGEDLEIEKNGTKSPWNTTFTGNHAKWSVIWTAAWNYWYGDIYGLKRPRQNVSWNQSLDIWVYYKNNGDYDDDIGDDDGNYLYGNFVERIAIRANDNKSHVQLYRTTTHEIAHSSQRVNQAKDVFNQQQMPSYSNLPTILKDSYADGIGRYLTNKRYGSETRSKTYEVGQYTGIFEDLEDKNSTHARAEKYGEEECDNVSGFTAPMLENAVFKSASWDDFKNNLKKDYPNFASNGEGGNILYTETGMDAMFSYWKNGTSPCPELSSGPVPLLASNLLSFNDRSYCVNSTSDYCPVVSMDMERGHSVILGVSARIGSILSGSSVFLRNRGLIFGDINTAGNLTWDNSSKVTGAITQNYQAVKDLIKKSYQPLLPDFNMDFTSNGTMQIPSGETIDLLPGRYEQNITVSSGSVLRLSPGSYEMGSLTVQAGAKIELQGSGTIALDIAGLFRWDGSFQGSDVESTLKDAARRLKVRLQDDQMTLVHTTFGGFILAPNAHIIVGQAEKRYVGQIYAKSITLHQDTYFLWVKPE